MTSNEVITSNICGLNFFIFSSPLYALILLLLRISIAFSEYSVPKTFHPFSFAVSKKNPFPQPTSRILFIFLYGSNFSNNSIYRFFVIDELVAQEAKKIDNGTSGLTNSQMSNGFGGMSLGETLLASAAGAMLGSYIGNKLFNNQNYQNRRKAGYKSPQTYSRSVNSFNKAKSGTYKRSTSNKRSGFFGSNRKSSSRSRSFFGG